MTLRDFMRSLYSLAVRRHSDRDRRRLMLEVRNMSVELRRQLLVIAMLVWMVLIAFLNSIIMMPGFVGQLSNYTGVPLVAVRDKFRTMMSAPLHAP